VDCHTVETGTCLFGGLKAAALNTTVLSSTAISSVLAAARSWLSGVRRALPAGRVAPGIGPLVLAGEEVAEVSVPAGVVMFGVGR